MINLIIKDIKELFHNKKVLIATILVPLFIIFTVYFIYVNTDVKRDNTITMGIVDNDDNFFSKLLIKYFEESEAFAGYFTIVKDDITTIEQLFYKGEIDTYIIIPEDFVKKMQYMEHEPLHVIINATNNMNSIIMNNITKGYEKYIEAAEVGVIALYNMMASDFTQKEIDKSNIDISLSLIMTALGRESFFEYIEIYDITATPLVNYYLYAIISILIMYSSIYVGMSILKEKNNNTFDRLIIAGVPILKVICSRIIVSSLYIFFIILLCYIAGTIVVGGSINLLSGIFILIGIVFCLSLSVMFSGFVRFEEGILLGGNTVFFILTILGGSIIPIEYLPDSLTRFSRLTPNYWFINIILGIDNNLKLGFVYGIMVSLMMIVIFIAVSTVVYIESW